jgi:surface antigen
MIRYRNSIRKRLLFAPVFLVSLLGTIMHAEAKSPTPELHGGRGPSTHGSTGHAHAKGPHIARRTTHHQNRYVRRWHHDHQGHRVAWAAHHGAPVLQCVPYARSVSGIELTGNAYRWWSEADGRYPRGNSPETGAVLSFRRSERMSLGHVAVVTETVNPREILITQANWAGPGLRQGAVSVIDVSPANDWTEVKVQIGRSDRYGAVYQTNGFIYGRHAPATLMAAGTAAGVAASGSAGWSQTVQLASGPSYGGTAIADTAPDRDLQY